MLKINVFNKDGQFFIDKNELLTLIDKGSESTNFEQENKVWWNMKDLELVTGYSDDWLKNNILFQPRYKKILDLENGGFVYYPEKRGEKWMFIASKMKEFLETYFQEIMN